MAQIYSQPAPTGTGSDARTNVIYAIDRLKEKSPTSIPSEELIAYVLPAHKRGDTQLIALFKRFLKVNDKVSYDETTDSYSFKPLHDIFTGNDLQRYLQDQEFSLGINVRELKDGWPNAQDTIDKLEAENALLVIRNKKDNHPRTVWSNDPTLIASVDDDYMHEWETLPLPDQQGIVRDLKREGHTPVGDMAEVHTLKVEKKKKKVRRGTKVTNVHMQNMLRDYSKHRPQAGT